MLTLIRCQWVMRKVQLADMCLLVVFNKDQCEITAITLFINIIYHTYHVPRQV